MELVEFATKIGTMVQEKMGSGYAVSNHQVRKNNGVVLNAITIRTEESNIAPSIYIEQFYDEVESGSKSMDEVAGEICETYEQNDHPLGFDVNSFIDFGSVKDRVIYRLVNYVKSVKDRVIYRLVNYEKNMDELADMPHDRYLDFAIIYCVLVPMGEMGATGTIMVTNDYLTMWGIGKLELVKLADRNTPRLLKSELVSMENLLISMMLGEDAVSDNSGKLPLGKEMYVLSNRSKMNGASCLLYPGLLAQIADYWGRDFYVLPSSVHETILIPDDKKMNPTVLTNMVREVNSTQLTPSEVLSDHVYFYSKSEKMLTAA